MILLLCPFVQLGRDLSGFLKNIQEAIPENEQVLQLQEKILKGPITLRVIYEKYGMMLKAGVVEQVPL